MSPDVLASRSWSRYEGGLFSRSSLMCWRAFASGSRCGGGFLPSVLRSGLSRSVQRLGNCCHIHHRGGSCLPMSPDVLASRSWSRYEGGLFSRSSLMCWRAFASGSRCGGGFLPSVLRSGLSRSVQRLGNCCHIHHRGGSCLPMFWRLGLGLGTRAVCFPDPL